MSSCKSVTSHRRLQSNWDSVSWRDFLGVLQSYRAKFFDGAMAEEPHYVAIMSRLEGVPLGDRAGEDITVALRDFLNAWRCGLNKKNTPAALGSWIAEYADQMEAIASLSILRDDPRAHQKIIEELYYSLFRLRRADPPVRTIGDAAASKILHVMQPHFFVMWDTNIKRAARTEYFEFMVAMHDLARRLRSESPPEARSDVESYLNRVLGYTHDKTFSKYLDEYNWHTIVGAVR